MSQQMPVVYPVTTTIPSTTHSSNGSYGTVFIVLAVIVTISVFACFLGRICNKRQNEAKPRTNTRPTKENDSNMDHKRKVNDPFKRKDGDVEFGFDKRFASAKVATTNEPNMTNPNPFGHEPNMGQPSSFHEPAVGRPNSFQEPNVGQSSQHSLLHKANKVQPSFSREPVMGRPNPYNEPAMGRPNPYNEPAMGRANSLNEPTMGQPANSFYKGDQSQGDQARFGGGDRDNDINFKFRTRPQRY